MADQPAESRPAEPRYGLTSVTPALEPGRPDFPQWPMTAQQASCFIPKVVA